MELNNSNILNVKRLLFPIFFCRSLSSEWQNLVVCELDYLSEFFLFAPLNANAGEVRWTVVNYSNEWDCVELLCNAHQSADKVAPNLNFINFDLFCLFTYEFHLFLYQFVALLMFYLRPIEFDSVRWEVRPLSVEKQSCR